MPSTNPTIRVVVTELEKRIIEDKAKQAGKSVSSFLKDLVLISMNPEANSQPDPRVSQLEQLVISMQVQIAEINHKLANSITNQESQVVSQPLANQDVLVLSIANLADRLAPKHIELSSAKSDVGKANLLRQLPDTLAKIKVANMPKWTADRDPEGLTWEPTDETRETWVVK